MTVSRAPLITLLTDFGTSDAYAGVLEGVIAGICPGARVISISHAIEPGDVPRGSFRWAQAVPFFPRGTIHVGIVDPGVGSDRRIIAARGPEGIFLAPDNGLLTGILRTTEIREFRSAEASHLHLETVSLTFHGRDIFAPVAAHLASGVQFSQVGPVLGQDPILLDPAPGAVSRDVDPTGVTLIRGRIEDLDRFGNAISGIRLGEEEASRVRAIQVGDLRLETVGRTYADRAPGEALALVGSGGFLEISVNGGNAGEAFELEPGLPVVVQLDP